jgi:hypothetical protein
MPAAVLLAALLGCEPLLLSPPRYGSVRVTVVTVAGTPVPNVPVNLYTGPRPIEYAQTDAAGAYTFQRVPPNYYGVTVTVPAGLGDIALTPFVSQDNIIIEGEMERSVTFTLVPCSGSIVAAVRDTAGGGVPNVPLTLYDRSGDRDSATTGTDGLHRFSTTCGEYGLRLAKGAGYAIIPGRGSEFVDSVRVTRATPDVTAQLRVRR